MTDTKENIREWFPDLEGAYGVNNPKVIKGLEAENLFYDWAMRVYDKVERHESDREKQNKGIDFTIYKDKWGPQGYTIDIKSMGFNGYKLEVDNTKDGWLRNPKKTSDRIVQINSKVGKGADYQRKKMIDFLDSLGCNPDDPRLAKGKETKDVSKITLYPWGKDKAKIPKGLVVFRSFFETGLSDFIEKE